MPLAAIKIILADQVSVGDLFEIVHNYVKPTFLAEISSHGLKPDALLF